MFEHFLGQIEQIPIGIEDLKQVVSVDQNTGKNVTLEDLLPEYASKATIDQFGLAPARAHRVELKPVRMLTEKEMRQVVDAFLDSIPENEALVIEGHGAFNANQLRDEVNRGTVVGRRITEIVRQDSMFLEEAIKQQKIVKKPTGPIEIPDFDF